MSRHIVVAADAPSSSLFSQAVRAGSAVYVSGTVGVDPATGVFPKSIEDQTRQALRNCETILAAAGCTLDDVALVTVLLAHPEDFAGMNEGYASVFSHDPPARAVARLGPELPGILVSIMMTAHAAD